MSYILDLVVSTVPANNAQAFDFLEQLRKRYYDDISKRAPVFEKFHDVLVEKYPCLCSYADDDPAMDDSPWADGPLIGNFASEMGMVAIIYSRAEEVVPFVIQSANALGITVLDSQADEVYRP